MNYVKAIKRFGSGRSFRKIGGGEYDESRHRYYITKMIKTSLDGWSYKFHAIESGESEKSFVIVSKESEAEEKEICVIRDIDFLDTVLDMCKSGRL